MQRFLLAFLLLVSTLKFKKNNNTTTIQLGSKNDTPDTNLQGFRLRPVFRPMVSHFMSCALMPKFEGFVFSGAPRARTIVKKIW